LTRSAPRLSTAPTRAPTTIAGLDWDRASESARLPDPPVGGHKRGADGLRVGNAPPAKREFRFLFDHGDEWHFGVKLLRAGVVEAGARLPEWWPATARRLPTLADGNELARLPARSLSYCRTRRFRAYISASAVDQAWARVPDGWRVAWPTQARMPAAWPGGR
jgi:hypothetical protein